jgi:hypothetical protein
VISYATYKVLHLLGLFGLFVTLAAALGRAAVLAPGTEDPWRRRLAAFHGVSLLVVLTGGFGLMARLGIMHGVLFPGWIWAKLGIWVVAGGLLGLAFRRSRWSGLALALLPLLAAVAGYLALNKPF